MSKRTELIRTHTPPSPEMEERFWQYVDKQECWNWTAATNFGYGVFTIKSVAVFAHRFIYEWLIGPVPNGYDVDHICHNRDKENCPGGAKCLHRKCVNPAHLEAVKPAVNRSRGITERPNNGNHWSSRTHCGHGHKFTPENTYIRMKDGKFWKRECRTCNRERVRKCMNSETTKKKH
jgi:hypothetical protein